MDQADTPRKTYLVLGASGFLGSYFSSTVKNSILHFRDPDKVTHSRENQNVIWRLDNEAEVRALLKNLPACTIINCIAETNMDLAESHQERTTWLNAELPKLLAIEARKRGFKLIHFSTDAVFHNQGLFRSESDEPIPHSIYGKTKLLGENSVLSEKSDALVLRVNFFGDNPKGNSLFNFFYKNLMSGNQVNGFSDIFFTPIYIEELVKLTLQAEINCPPGLYHLVGSQRISKYIFGRSIAANFKFDPELVIETNLHSQKELNGEIRSRELSLSNQKIQRYGITIGTIENGLYQLKRNIANQGVQ